MNLSNNVYKIYNDGSHYIGTLISSLEKKRDSKINADNSLFDMHYYRACQLRLSGQFLIDYMKENLSEILEAESDQDGYIQKNIERCQRNAALRKKRFKRKAHLNKFNYFVTFTYDDKKMTEDEFRSGLKKCLSNLHTRRGWLYMGVFERAPETNRLHFHGLIYVPENEMLGSLDKVRSFDKKSKKLKTTYINSFFENRFGRNDFQEIDEVTLSCSNAIGYVLKYISKSGEKIVYSRDIPSEIYREIASDDIAAEFFNFVNKFILYDDVIMDDSFNNFNKYLE